jgi:hypothetical protein
MQRGRKRQAGHDGPPIIDLKLGATNKVKTLLSSVRSHLISAEVLRSAIDGITQIW